MPVFRKQNTFTSGEISPRLKGRTDFAKYDNATQTMLNCYVHPQGGCTKRSGTQYINTVKDSSKEVRLVPFEFSTEQTYILEFGNLYVRFYKDQGRIEADSTNAISAITKANPGNVEHVAHGLVTGDTITFENVGGMTELNGNNYTVTKVDADNYTIGVDTTGYTTWTSGGDEIIEVTTTYTEAELPALSFTQSADTLFIAHGSHATATLARSSHTSWTLADITFTGGPFLSENTTATTLTPSATTGAITITASSVTGINDGSGFLASDVGRLVTITHSTTDGIARITALTDTTHVNATVETAFGATTAQSTWSLGAWGGTISFPKFVNFFENRLVLASNSRDTQAIWFSKIGVYTDFLSGTDDNDPVNTRIVSNFVNSITWTATSRDALVVGTTGGEWTLEGDASTGITPSALKQRRESTHGSKVLQALPIESQALFVQRQGKNVLEFRFVFESDSYQAPELSILAEHLTRSNTITYWTYAEEPNAIVWSVRDDGVLLGMTYKRTQDVVGWHRHTTEASGEFESVATISGDDRDEVWVSVKRTINGGTVRYVELLRAEFNPGTDTDATNSCFLDSSLSYSGSATDTFTGLDHLEGESISVLADGKVHPNVTVSSGSITLNYDASVVHAGISYNADIETLPIELSDQQGTSSGRTKRVSRTVLKVHETVGLKVGKDSSNLEYIPFNDGQVYGSAIDLFSGDKVIDNYVGNSLESVIYIRQDQPLPMTVLSISTEIEVNDR